MQALPGYEVPFLGRRKCDVNSIRSAVQQTFTCHDTGRGLREGTVGSKGQRPRCREGASAGVRNKGTAHPGLIM